jgi:peroxiredoxin
MSVAEGKKAPDFSAATDGGGKLKLSDLRGRPVVLYSIPRTTRRVARPRPAASATVRPPSRS